MRHTLSIILLLLLVSCTGHDAKKDPQACFGCNVIVILVDTLRADHLSLYGYHRVTSPNIDAFAESAVVFGQARSQASCTWPSVNSLLTSRHPFSFLGRADGIGIPASIESLPDILKADGYRTIAVSGSPIVRNTPSTFNGKAGFGNGFDVFEECECEGEECSWRYKPHATCINERAMKHLDGASPPTQPLFLYLHYMDVHSHYDPPGDSSRTFGPPYEGGKAWVSAGNPNPIERMLSGNGEDVELTDEDLLHLIDLYDDEIHYFDSQFLRLMNQIERSGLGKNSIVVLVSDHGEGFMEHESVKHCHTLFDTEIRTPLVVRLPSGSPRGRRTVLAENLDLVPTVVDYLGLDHTKYDFDGVSLRPAIERDEPVRRFSFSSQNALRSVAGGRYKMIYNLENEEALLFDLEKDPEESIDLAARDPVKLAELRVELLRWLREVEGNGAEALQRSKEVSRETEEKLRAIGYIE